MMDKLEYKTIFKSSEISNKRRRSAKPWWNDNLAFYGTIAVMPKNDGLNVHVNHVQQSSNFDLFMLVSQSYLIRMFRRQRRYWYDVQTDLLETSEDNPQVFWKTIGKADIAFWNKKKIPMEVVGENGEIISDINAVLGKWKIDFQNYYSSKMIFLALKMNIRNSLHAYQSLKMKFLF